MWAITKDYTAGPGDAPGTNMNAVGVCGPRTCGLSFAEIIAQPEAEIFRMYDDDGELYYEGVYVAAGDGDELSPLSDYGEPNAGATSIKYKRGSVWVDM